MTISVLSKWHTRYNNWVISTYVNHFQFDITDWLCLIPWLQCRSMTFVAQLQRHEWHDDVIKWKYFSRYWPFVRGIHRSPVDSPYKGKSRGALMFSLICARANDSANNRDAGDLRRHCVHYDVIVMNRGAPCALGTCVKPPEKPIGDYNADGLRLRKDHNTMGGWKQP